MKSAESKIVAETPRLILRRWVMDDVPAATHIYSDPEVMQYYGGAERFSRDPEIGRALLRLARHEDSRKCLILMHSILDAPELVDRLLAVLGPAEENPGVVPIRREAV